MAAKGCIHGAVHAGSAGGESPLRFSHAIGQGLKPLFTLGRVVATPGALAAIGVSGDDLSSYLARHQSGDWGAIDAHDRKENNFHLTGIPADVRVHTQYYPGQDLDNYGSRLFVYLHFAVRRILTWTQ